MSKTNDTSTEVVVVGGQKVRVLVQGKEGAPWLVLSNSVLADLYVWDDQIDLLKAKFRVLRFDTRGHGGSQASPAPYDFPMLVQDVVGLLDHFGIERAHFVGLSLGGMVGYGLALAHPERFLSMTIVSSRADAPAAFCAPWDERIALVQQKGTQALATPTTERWFAPAYLTANPQTRQRIVQMIQGTSSEGFEGCARALQNLNYLPQLASIDLPIQLIAGANDGTMPADMLEIHRLIARSGFEIIQNAGHIPNIENTPAFNRILLKFLDQAGSPIAGQTVTRTGV